MIRTAAAVARTALTILATAVVTVVLATLVLVAVALRVTPGPRSVFARAPRWWSAAVLWSAGVRVRVHGAERAARVTGAGGCIFMSNHVSLFDIPALVHALPPVTFVAKAELFGIPVFGAGIRAVGTIPIERENRKAAFGAYDVAAGRLAAGASVMVFPEGTRGYEYPVRPFKKGPFVLAVKAGVPVVPCIVHGTIEILPKRTFLIRRGVVDVHVLDPVPTDGLSYGDRDALATEVHARMEAAMSSLYLDSQPEQSTRACLA